MRKPRDYDSELKALDNKAKQLRTRKVQQLGELVIATGADALAIEQLAGAMLAAADANDTATKEAWRKRGTTFFQGAARKSAGNDRGDARGDKTDGSGATPVSSEDRS
jgi:hypothetical protein